MTKKPTNGYFDKNVKITSYVNFAYDKESRHELDTDVNRYSTTSSTANLDIDRDEDSRTPTSSTLDSSSVDCNSQLDGQPSKLGAYSGILCAMASSVFFTLTAAIVKYLKDVHPGLWIFVSKLNQIQLN